MKERPILFSSPMVRAILDGRKTQTRRVVRQRPGPFHVGLNLWVREMWGYSDTSGCVDWKEDGSADVSEWIREAGNEWREPAYWAWLKRPARSLRAGWRPSIHMPRWACRIVLEVTGVRIERVQDITEADAVAEGVACYIAAGGKQAPEMSMRAQFGALWNGINAGRGYGWNANPWVWALTFVEVDGMAAVPDSV